MHNVSTSSMCCVPANQRFAAPIWPSAARLPISEDSGVLTVGLVGASGASRFRERFPSIPHCVQRQQEQPPVYPEGNDTYLKWLLPGSGFQHHELQIGLQTHWSLPCYRLLIISRSGYLAPICELFYSL